ncbi:D-2-hydroxyacid dehydrogenase [Mesonia maritima]|uniref:D-3-phosphoglycerate dehydrogenase n=1 Tax=Mesonia maritima TaxID=1793873 RepID=A0ABU1K981_9FLAO|nr:D-2-hydroxyacid dehydrogenase [Mesonia maritima]MDR6302159.1 D-3-phosphoglycerate dehydrogenase [Mesonia maritima]
MKILANDGISAKGIQQLEKEGFEVITTKVAQDQLADYINEKNIEVILVRSATKIRKNIIDACPNLKMIGRGGVGLDNIDVDYAKEKGVKVINTPAASSASVAELVFAHLLSSIRFLKNANRDMPLEGDSKFKELKKSYAKGTELRGKTLGIIGFGRIGNEVAKMALGLGMKVIASDKNMGEKKVTLNFFDGQEVTLSVKTQPVNEVLKEADFVTLHVPAQKDYIIGKKEIEIMKDGAGIINTARGGVVDEQALIEALENKKLAFAGLDVFENEPSPEIKILMNPKLSLSPHIGGATNEAQDRIGVELADQIIAEFAPIKY